MPPVYTKWGNYCDEIGQVTTANQVPLYRHLLQHSVSAQTMEIFSSPLGKRKRSSSSTTSSESDPDDAAYENLLAEISTMEIAPKDEDEERDESDEEIEESSSEYSASSTQEKVDVLEDDAASCGDEENHPDIHHPWEDDPQRFDFSRLDLTEYMDESDIVQIYIFLLEGRGNGYRGSARQLRGIITPDTNWGWIYLAIKQRWPDMVNPELTVNGHHIVKDICNNGKLTGRVDYHKEVKEIMFIRSAQDDDEPEEYVETENTQGVTLVVGVHEGLGREEELGRGLG